MESLLPKSAPRILPWQKDGVKHEFVRLVPREMLYKTVNLLLSVIKMRRAAQPPLANRNLGPLLIPQPPPQRQVIVGRRDEADDAAPGLLVARTDDQILLGPQPLDQSIAQHPKPLGHR